MGATLGRTTWKRGPMTYKELEPFCGDLRQTIPQFSTEGRKTWIKLFRLKADIS